MVSNKHAELHEGDGTEWGSHMWGTLSYFFYSFLSQSHFALKPRIRLTLRLSILLNCLAAHSSSKVCRMWLDTECFSKIRTSGSTHDHLPLISAPIHFSKGCGSLFLFLDISTSTTLKPCYVSKAARALKNTLLPVLQLELNNIWNTWYFQVHL